ncbi:MAG: ABC transporter ATP-binding protein [Oscillospiraceae bacterium]|nr:ABC transporter ATP-binding protein [Oscillospiraceae bacterium]
MDKAIIVSNVDMHFNMSKFKIDSIKEYLIKLFKRELMYQDFIALKDISLEIPKGDVFGIVGLNGSGKSTLLKIISGILKPSKGYVKIYGVIAPLIELGAGFDMELTARENIFLNGSVLGFSRQTMKDKFDEIVDFSEMEEFLDVPMKNYSSGMVARIAFAVATITQPDILIVDEILAVGDFRFQQKCEDRINQLMSGGTTVVIVSHSIEQIERLCKHCMWLEHGKIKMIGDKQEVCDAYKNS